MSMEINNNVTSQIVDLKTSTPGVTRKEETGVAERQKTERVYGNAREYKNYLAEKYNCLKSKDYSVSVNSSLMAKAATDEKTAQWLEYNLSIIPETVEKTKAIVEARGSKVISHSIKINGYDSMSAELCTVAEADPGTDKARENLEKRLEKMKEEKKKAKKKEEREAEKSRIEKEEGSKTDEITVSVVGTDINSITAQLTEKLTSGSVSGVVGFDVKA